MGEIYGIYKYSMFAVNLIGEIPEDVDDKFFNNILELTKEGLVKQNLKKENLI